jgi:hypothetical protein
VLLRDRLHARLVAMGASPDYVRLAEEVLAIRRAPPGLARRLVEQALVVEDRRDAWRRLGERVLAAAPETAGVYVMRDDAGRALYVGKALNLRRRLGAHFAPGRWKGVKAAMSRVEKVDWRVTGSELEALLEEARWIRELDPVVNVQRAPRRPQPGRRAVCDLVVVLPSSEPDAVELVAARGDGGVLQRRTGREGRHLAADAARFWAFFACAPQDGQPGGLDAGLVFSWLLRRGSRITRIETRDLVSADDLRARLAAALSSPELFDERIVVRNSSAGGDSGPGRR